MSRIIRVGALAGAFFLVTLCSAQAQWTLEESFDAQPVNWDLAENTVDPPRLYLSQGRPAHPPGEWRDFLLELDVVVHRGSLEVSYGPGFRLIVHKPDPDQPPVTIRLQAPGLQSEGTRAVWNDDRTLGLRVQNGQHSVDLDGRQILTWRARTGPGRIGLSATEDGLASVDAVRIRSLDLRILDVVPEQLSAGESAKLFVVGESLEQHLGARFPEGGIRVLAVTPRNESVLQIDVTVAADARGPRSLVLERRGLEPVTRRDAVRILPAPPPPEPLVEPRIDRISPLALQAGAADQRVIAQGVGFAELGALRIIDPGRGAALRTEGRTDEQIELRIDIDESLSERPLTIQFPLVDAERPPLNGLLWIREAEAPTSPRIEEIVPPILEPARSEQSLLVRGSSLGAIESVRVISPSEGVRARMVGARTEETLPLVVDVASSPPDGVVQLAFFEASPAGAPQLQTVGVRPALVEPALPGSWWSVALGALALGVMVSFGTGFVTGRASALDWLRWAKRRWEDLSRLDLPKKLVACRWICRCTPKTELANWEVDEIIVEPLDLGSDSREVESLSGAALGDLNDRSKVKLWLVSPEKLEAGLRPAAQAISQVVAKWSEQGASPAEIRLTAKFQKPLEMLFELKHCEMKEGKLDWVTRRKWARAIKPGRPVEVGTIAGPLPEEPFVERIEKDSQRLLMSLFQRVRSMP